MTDKPVTYCGLCQIPVDIDKWDEHAESEEHRRNVGDPDKVIAAIEGSQGGLQEIIKEGLRKMRKEEKEGKI